MSVVKLAQADVAIVVGVNFLHHAGHLVVGGHVAHALEQSCKLGHATKNYFWQFALTVATCEALKIRGALVDEERDGE